ncbi:hypothetical protein PAXINDRAFT_165129 [Paxillus involutus ATCC 200175]|nr:hypothetical protein PAXINDRAFT_165129 [Paxillus involutus ATCC 200175]
MAEGLRVNELERWQRLTEEQSAIFHQTLSENTFLRDRVNELEQELSVWKLAFKTAETEKNDLQKNLLKLEKSIGSMKDDNPLFLCLIDGDGNIFSQELLTAGHTGGRQAAMLLTKGLTDYMVETDAESSGRGQVWLTVYCNKSGLMDTLVNNDICTVGDFEAFVLGFNQSSPLFSIVDVGGGKEAADAKIKECLRIFTRFPQTSRVFFGGGHDNGYTSTLSHLENEGLLKKIILLRGYQTLAAELQHFDLHQLHLEGVFMANKLPSNHKKTHTTSSIGMRAPENDKSHHLSQEFYPATLSGSATPGKNRPFLRYLDPSLPLNKNNPRPCTFFYLSKCKQGDKCTYGHNYYMTPENLAELRANAKKSPCPMVNRNQPCPYGQSCPSGHLCPKGAKCPYKKTGKCKFSGRTMHIDIVERHNQPTGQGSGAVSRASSPSTTWDPSGSSSVASPPNQWAFLMS